MHATSGSLAGQAILSLPRRTSSPAGAKWASAFPAGDAITAATLGGVAQGDDPARAEAGGAGPDLVQAAVDEAICHQGGCPRPGSTTPTATGGTPHCG